MFCDASLELDIKAYTPEMMSIQLHDSIEGLALKIVWL